MTPAQVPLSRAGIVIKSWDEVRATIINSLITGIVKGEFESLGKYPVLRQRLRNDDERVAITC